jgi:GT2 family glycosyltransferase
MPAAGITVSVVSHRQNALVNALLGDLARWLGAGDTVVLTENVADEIALSSSALPCPVSVLRNERPRGFGANHNAAFARCQTPYFCVVNPDIRLPSSPFPALLGAFARGGVFAAGPLVRSPGGSVEDSARRFPTAAALLAKLVSPPAGPDYPVDRGTLEVDWIAGMFMLLDARAFRALGGFDERYFLYYEDVDLCRRARKQGHHILYVPSSEVTHDARRASRRDFGLMRHHVTSALRFLTSKR